LDSDDEDEKMSEDGVEERVDKEEGDDEEIDEGDEDDEDNKKITEGEGEVKEIEDEWEDMPKSICVSHRKRTLKLFLRSVI
jgi:hypothetical protein